MTAPGPKELARRSLREWAVSVVSRVLWRGAQEKPVRVVLPSPGIEAARVHDATGAHTYEIVGASEAQMLHISKALSFYEAHLTRSREGMRRTRAKRKAPDPSVTITDPHKPVSGNRDSGT